VFVTHQERHVVKEQVLLLKTDRVVCVPVGVCGWGRQGRLQEAVGGV